MACVRRERSDEHVEIIESPAHRWAHLERPLLVEYERVAPRTRHTVARERLLQEARVLAGFTRNLLWLDGPPTWWPSGKAALLYLKMLTIAVGLCLLGVLVAAAGATLITFHWFVGGDVAPMLLEAGAALFVLGTLVSVATLFLAVIRLLVCGA